MLTGERIQLRARMAEDLPLLHEGLYEDVATRIRGDTRPWVPAAPGAEGSPFAGIVPVNADVAIFSAIDANSGDLAGEALLYRIDSHNRRAHVGLALLPTWRGRGLAAPILELLCRYGFGIRGLRRLQLETLADNEPMIRAAGRAGFVEEGRLRGSRWVDGGFVDELVFARLTDAAT